LIFSYKWIICSWILVHRCIEETLIVVATLSYLAARLLKENFQGGILAEGNSILVHRCDHPPCGWFLWPLYCWWLRLLTPSY